MTARMYAEHQIHRRRRRALEDDVVTDHDSHRRSCNAAPIRKPSKRNAARYYPSRAQLNSLSGARFPSARRTRTSTDIPRLLSGFPNHVPERGIA